MCVCERQRQTERQTERGRERKEILYRNHPGNTEVLLKPKKTIQTCIRLLRKILKVHFSIQNSKQP